MPPAGPGGYFSRRAVLPRAALPLSWYGQPHVDSQQTERGAGLGRREGREAGGQEEGVRRSAERTQRRRRCRRARGRGRGAPLPAEAVRQLRRVTGLFRPAIADLVPYEPGKPVEEVQRELGLDRVVKLASNEGPFPPFAAAREAMDRAAADLNRYPDGGAWELRSALAARHGVRFEEIVVGSGADGVIDLLSQATLDP